VARRRMARAAQPGAGRRCGGRGARDDRSLAARQRGGRGGRHAVRGGLRARGARRLARPAAGGCGMGLRRNAPAALALDLAAGRRRPGWPGWLLLALGVLALAFELLGFVAARADLAEREAIVARLRAELRVNEAARGAGRAAADADRVLEPAPARKVAAQLQADWPALFGG